MIGYGRIRRHADGPCKAGTPGCTNGVQQNTAGARLAFDSKDSRNQKAADKNPVFLIPEKNGQSGDKRGGEIEYKLNRSPDDTTHYTIIQAESTADRVPAVSEFEGDISVGSRDNRFTDKIDTGGTRYKGDTILFKYSSWYRSIRMAIMRVRRNPLT